MNNQIKYRVIACLLGLFGFYVLASNLCYIQKDSIRSALRNTGSNSGSFFLKCQTIKNSLIEALDKELDAVSERNYTRPFFVQIYGWVLKQIHPYIIKDEFHNIIRLENDHLTIRSNKHFFLREAQQMVRFNSILSEKKIPFVFVLAPHKVCKYAPMLGKGVTDYSNENADFFLDFLRQGNVEFVDCREILKDSPELHYNWFYKTDTHWKSEYAFRVFQELTPTLEKYGIEIDPRALNKDNYTIFYNGKVNDLTMRLGSWYMSPDPMQYMKPKWKTQMKLSSLYGNLDYTGPFQPSVFFRLFPDLQVLNMDANTPKKILFFSDSFGMYFSCFLPFACSHLEIRIMNKYPGNLLHEIVEFHPDLVIGMFTARDTYYHCAKFGLDAHPVN